MLSRAKALAAREHKSLSALIAETLQQRVEQDEGYQSALERQMRLMQVGFRLSKPYPNREDLHERGA